MVDDVPRVLGGRYEVGGLIGRGGMAEVHIGRDNRLGRTVAIKILRSDLARDPSFQARFRREAQSAASLNHPAIVSVYDTGDDTVRAPDGTETQVPFIVMEYVEGHTVRDLLRDGSALPIDEAIEITTGVLSALEYSHHAAIVHRDIKPGNVMLTPVGDVKVMDFGIARAMADASATMTQTQAVIGTAQYLSPEQARGEVVDTRSDLYSTGCLLYELLTGRPPFEGDSAVAVAYQHVSEAPQPPSVVAPDVPESLDRIVLKALAKDREERYSTAAEFRADLEAAARNGEVSAPAIGAMAAAAANPAAPTQVLGAEAPPATEPEQAPLEEMESAEEEEGGRSNKALVWILVAIGLLTAAGIAFLVWDRGNDVETATVPDLTGMTEEEVTQALRDVNLQPDFTYESHEEIEEGIAISWDPDTGTEIELTEDQSNIVQVAISTGPEVVVPDLTGMTEAEVTEALDEVGLEPDFTYEADEEIEEGIAISWDPDTGTVMGEGETTVEVTISTGPDAVEVPDVSGLTQTRARDVLTAAGFTNVRTDYEDAPRVAEDVAIETEPGAGESVSPDTEITLVLGTGNVVLENTTGATLEEAEEYIVDELGLSIRVHDQEDSGEPGIVLSQEETGIVPQGTTVTVYVSVEPAPTPTQPDDDEDGGGDGGDGDGDGGGDGGDEGGGGNN